MSLKHPAFGILSGFLALCLVLVLVILHKQKDVQLLLLVTVVAFFLAGALRGASSKQDLSLNLLLIGLGGVLPVYVMGVTGMAFITPDYVPLFFAFSIPLAAAGVQASRLFVRGRPKIALLLTLFSFAVDAVCKQ